MKTFRDKGVKAEKKCDMKTTILEKIIHQNIPHCTLHKP